MKHARAALLSTAIFLGSISSSHAICHFPINPNSPTTGNHYIYTPIQKYTRIFNDPNTVGIGMPFGILDMIMQSNARHQENPSIMICGGGSNLLQLTGIGNPMNENIYPSNLPGIGFRITIKKYPGSPYDSKKDEIPYPQINQFSTMYRKEAIIKVSLSLIRIGQITCTGPFSGTFAQDAMDGQILGEFRF